MKDSRNILVLSRECPPYVLGGQSYHLRYLYEQLSKLGHDITIIGGRCRESMHRDISFSTDVTTHIVKYPTISAQHLQYPVVAKWALRNFNMNNYDIIVAHTEFPFSVDTPLIAKRHDCKAATCVNVSSDRGPMQKLVDWTHTAVSKRSVKVADYEVFNSNLCFQYWQQYYESEKKASAVVHNGVDLGKFYPTGGNKDYILHVGGTSRKGIEGVLSYAEKAQYPIRIVGDVDVEHPNVTTTGPVSQSKLRRMYSEANVTIHPARFEAFGLVILESLACGTPVVVSDQCGAAELLTDKTGIVTDDIVAGVRTALQMNQSDCVALAEQYSWEKVARRTEDIISTVLRNSSQ